MKINEFIETKTPVQQAIEEHVARGVPFRECIFRPGSTAFREFYRTVRDMHSQGLLELDWEDEELLETDIGELVRLNDEVVPLDVPFVEENEYRLPASTAGFRSGIRFRNGGLASGPVDKKTYDQEMAAFKQSKTAPKPTVPNLIKKNGPRVNEEMSDDEIDAFHRELDAVVHKHLGHSSDEEEQMDEAEYNGKKVKLNSPKRGGSKKFYVYVKNPKTGRVKKISWGDTTGLSVKAKNKGAVKSFVARHKCKQANDKTTARYWSCRTPRYKSLGVKGGQWW